MLLTLVYFKLQDEYTQKFGRRAIVAMQVGAFYEFYQYDPDQCPDLKQRTQNGQIYNQPLGRADLVAEALDDRITKKSGKKPHAITNPYMVGFPLVAYENKKRILLAHGFILVRIDQVPDDPQDPTLIRLKGKKGSKECRKVTEIVSSSTDINGSAPLGGTNNITTIYVEYQTGNRAFEDFSLTCGVSSIDVTTGICRVSEVHSSQADRMSAIQEIRRFLLAQQPREVIVHVNQFPQRFIESGVDMLYWAYSKFLREHLDLDRYENLLIYYNQVPEDYLKAKYQEQFLQRVYFSEEKVLTADKASVTTKSFQVGQILNRLSLERMAYGRVGFLLLLQYCYEHNEKTIEHVKFPDTEWIDARKHMTLTYNAIQQLNILPQPQNGSRQHAFLRERKGVTSLFEVLNFTSTKMGHRLLQDRLVNPLTDPQELDRSYQMIFQLQNAVDHESKPLLISLRTMLKELPDVERYHRKLRLVTITPRDLSILIKAYQQMARIYTLIYTMAYGPAPIFEHIMLGPDQALQYNQFMERLGQEFDLLKLQTCTILTVERQKLLDFEECPLLPGVYPQLDQLQVTIKIYEKNLDDIRQYLNRMLDRTKGKSSSVESQYFLPGKRQDVNGFVLLTSEASSKKLKKLEKAGELDLNICGSLDYSKLASKQRISSSRIEEFTSALETNKQQLRQQLWEIYHRLLLDAAQMSRPSDDNFHQPLVNFISQLDFVASGSLAAQKYKYHRPILSLSDSQLGTDQLGDEQKLDSESDSESEAESEILDGSPSFLRVRDVRHPIIERIIDQAYISNDVGLGREEADHDPQSAGYLLYGANSTGKSSLAKALGLTIIMAQAGLYTPGHLRFKPYKRIITRLSGHDDILKGQSSFMIEIEELRILLNNADNQTLVLGDELCRGTESLSGTGLTLATLEKLIRLESSFIFSTHMHHLVQMPELQALTDQLRVCHLSVRHDTSLGQLVIGRKLQEGSGSTSYGIEIAKSMGLDLGLIQRASQIRQSFKQGSGQLLNTKKSAYNKGVYMGRCMVCGTERNLHSHHFEPQKLADPQGFVQHRPKDRAGNLISLCQECHQKVHHDGLELKLATTGGGVQLTIG